MFLSNYYYLIYVFLITAATKLNPLVADIIEGDFSMTVTYLPADCLKDSLKSKMYDRLTIDYLGKILCNFTTRSHSDLYLITD